MCGTESAVAELARRLFADHAEPQDLLLKHDDAWRGPFAAALDELGLAQAFVAEADGGPGIIGLDLGRVCVAAGEFALSFPLVEVLLVQRLAVGSGLKLDPFRTTLAPAKLDDRISIDASGRIDGQAHQIALAPEHESVLVLNECTCECFAALVALEDCTVERAQNLAGEMRASVILDSASAMATASLPAGTLAGMVLAGAIMRACQMAGALRKALELARDYALERTAFGRPIGKFQAVQHQLACMAGEAAGLEAAALHGASHLDDVFSGSPQAWQAGVCAKIKAGSAAQEGARIAHQVFGAIGFTQEHVLHRYTNALLSWRDDYGSETEWARRLGSAMAKDGPEGFWPGITEPHEHFVERIVSEEGRP